jgi:hypothetical protein
MSEPALYRLVTFYIPNLISIFLSIGQISKKSTQVRGPLWHFITNLLFTVTICQPHAQSPSWRAVRDCLFNIYSATLHIQRPSPSSATWGRANQWWQGTDLTSYMYNKIWSFHLFQKFIFVFQNMLRDLHDSEY